MLRRSPKRTRTDTLSPYWTADRSPAGYARDQHALRHAARLQCLRHRVELRDGPCDRFIVFPRREALIGGKGDLLDQPPAAGEAAFVRRIFHREARRVDRKSTRLNSSH